MAGVGVGGGTLSILLVLWRVFLWVNHKTVRSRCCGHTAEVGIDVDSPATAAEAPRIKVPAPVECPASPSQN